MALNKQELSFSITRTVKLSPGWPATLVTGTGGLSASSFFLFNDNCLFEDACPEVLEPKKFLTVVGTSSSKEYPDPVSSLLS